MVFSKFGDMFKKQGDGPDATPAEEVHRSRHLLAERAGSVLCVTVESESVTDREAGIIFDETDALIDDRTAGLVVDLRNVCVLSSAGIGTLVRLHKRIGERKGKLAVCMLNEELAELFKLTRIDKLVSLTDTQEAAIRAVS